MMSSYSPPSSPAVSEISVGSPSPPPRKQLSAHIKQSFYPIHKRLKNNVNYENKERCPSPRAISKSNAERVKSFSIADILGHETKNQENNEKLLPQPNQPTLPNFDFHHEDQPTKIVRPWDHLRGPIPVRPFLPPLNPLLHYEHRLALDYQRQLQEHFHAQAQLLRQMSMDIIPSESGSERSSSVASDRCSPEPGRLCTSESQRNHQTKTIDCDVNRIPNSSTNGQQNGTPLDALFQMTTKDFNDSPDQSHLDLFSTRPTPKKKRKSRTAFTNHQIFELEKRFLYQKYLSPADRDEIAGGLGLSNSQVITWFQNRRAKLKRDMEELKKDVESVNALSAHKSFLENVNDLSILKRSPITNHERTSDASESSLSNGNYNCSPKKTTAEHFKNDDLDV